MSSVSKLIQKMKEQPHGIRFQEAEKILFAYGYNFSRQKGSHCHYINCSGDVITLRNENPLKRTYIDDILSRIGEK
ncbi:hypothetical protein FACS1894167_09540 [Synergistales bacterium]|nr:hypothetical protein FACS1894167_09540 [Synergistales bacterium]